MALQGLESMLWKKKTFSPTFNVLFTGQIKNKITNVAIITEPFAKLSVAQIPAASAVF